MQPHAFCSNDIFFGMDKCARLAWGKSPSLADSQYTQCEAVWVQKKARWNRKSRPSRPVGSIAHNNQHNRLLIVQAQKLFAEIVWCMKKATYGEHALKTNQELHMTVVSTPLYYFCVMHMSSIWHNWRRVHTQQFGYENTTTFQSQVQQKYVLMGMSRISPNLVHIRRNSGHKPPKGEVQVVVQALLQQQAVTPTGQVLVSTACALLVRGMKKVSHF